MYSWDARLLPSITSYFKTPILAQAPPYRPRTGRFTALAHRVLLLRVLSPVRPETGVAGVRDNRRKLVSAKRRSDRLSLVARGLSTRSSALRAPFRPRRYKIPTSLDKGIGTPLLECAERVRVDLTTALPPLPRPRPTRLCCCQRENSRDVVPNAESPGLWLLLLSPVSSSRG